MLSTSTMLVYWAVTVVVCMGIALSSGAKADKENEKTTALQKVMNRILIVVPIVVVVVSTILFFRYMEKAETTVISEKSFSVVDADLQAEDKTINLTIQDQNGTTAEVTYGLPDYPNLLSNILNIRSSVINELQPNGNSDILILQEFADGNRKVVLEGSEGGKISDMLESYALKMAAE